jgi:hypothetical protein
LLVDVLSLESSRIEEFVSDIILTIDRINVLEVDLGRAKGRYYANILRASERLAG